MGDTTNGDQAAFDLDIPVRFAETDMMGVVHHSNYLIWFEAARVAFMDAAGMPYREVAASGNHFAVTAVQVEYRASVYFGETVRVRTSVGKLRSRQIVFNYAVHNATGDMLLATGRTDHICVDTDGRMARIPEAILDRLAAGIERLKVAL